MTSIKSLSCASLAVLAICAARASAAEMLCVYDLAQFERDQASGLRIDVPDCFFHSLESAAAGGDPQAAVEIGISLLEGYSDEPGAKNPRLLVAQRGYASGASKRWRYIRCLYGGVQLLNWAFNL